MRKIFLLFGSEGNLGKVVKKVILSKNFEHVFLFDSKFKKPVQSYGNVTKIKIDNLTVEKNVEEAFNNIQKKTRGEYHLFSTIGIFNAGKGIENLTVKEWQTALDVNLTVPFLLGKHFLKFIKQIKSKGSICFTGALSSLAYENNKSNYIISKNALNTFVNLLALEGKEFGVSANVIAPYIIDTKENRKWVENKSDLISPKRIGDFVYLLTENYSFISGNIIKMPWTLD